MDGAAMVRDLIRTLIPRGLTRGYARGYNKGGVLGFRCLLILKLGWMVQPW